MDELTEEQRNRLGGFNEQLSSIKKNIEVANSELESILIKKDEALNHSSEEHLALKQVVSLLKKERENLMETIKIETKKIESERLTLEIDRLTQDAPILEHMKRISRERADMNMTKALTSEELAEDKMFISLMQSYTAELQEIKYQLETDIGFCKSTITSLDNNIQEIRRKQSLAITEFNESNQSIKLQIDSVNKELESARMLVAQEIEKVKVPLQSLHDEQESFESKKKDVKVLYNRAQKMWSVMYPGKSIEEIDI